MEKKSGWPIAMKYGLILAFASIVINLGFYLIEPNSFDSKFKLSNVLQFLITAIASVYILMMAGKIRRDEDLDGYVSYGKALGFSMQTSIPAALIIAFYTYIFFTYISPEFLTKMWEMQAEQMAQSGKSDEEIELAMSMSKKFSSPLIMTVFGAFGVMFQMLIFSLIASIFVKKELQTID
jgi:hypothetical protein